MNCSLKYCILCVILGMFIGANWFASCVTEEGMEVAGAALKYAMSERVPCIKKHGTKPVYNPNDTYEKVQIPLPEGQLIGKDLRFRIDPGNSLYLDDVVYAFHQLRCVCAMFFHLILILQLHYISLRLHHQIF